MTDTDTTAADGPVIRIPEAIPVTMSGEGVGDMFEATREFIEGSTLPQIAVLETPDGDVLPLLANPGHELKPVPQDWIDRAAGRPERRKGTATMTSLDSFIDHVNRFGDSDSAVFVNDGSAPSLTAVLDYNRKDTLATEGEGDERIHGGYRFGEHRTAFRFPLSEEWVAWNEDNASPMDMIQFSTFLEKRAADIDGFDDGVIPDSLKRFVEVNGGTGNVASFGQLIELSRGLKVNEAATVGQTINLASGEGKIVFEAEHQTSVKVPTMFFIAIPVFNRGAYYRIGAALRYRKVGSGLKFWYELNRPDVAFKHALDEAAAKVSAETEAQVFYGSPE